MLWHESAGAPQRGENVESNREPVFSHILRLAVVKENQASACVCPSIPIAVKVF
jgi:hypothetical protein